MRAFQKSISQYFPGNLGKRLTNGSKNDPISPESQGRGDSFDVIVSSHLRLIDFVSLNLRLNDLLGPVTRVKKKEKKSPRTSRTGTMNRGHASSGRKFWLFRRLSHKISFLKGPKLTLNRAGGLVRRARLLSSTQRPL